jgi:hypothetical protein
MIPDWSTPSECLAFLDGSFGRRPYAQPGAASATVPLLHWTTLDRVLGSPLTPKVLTVATGRLANGADASLVGRSARADGARHQHRDSSQ